MTKNSKQNRQAQFFGGQQNARSMLKSLQAQLGALTIEQQRFKTEILALAKEALAARNDSGWAALTKLVEKLENM